MKTIKQLLAAAVTALLMGFIAMQPAQGQQYGYPGGYRPQPYPAPPYPGGYQTPPQQPAAAETKASVEILAPQDGAVVSRSAPLVLEYAVVPGPKGDHVHIYVDGREAAIVRQLKGSYRVGRLAPGPHELAIKVVNRAHVPIGVEASLKVTVQ